MSSTKTTPIYIATRGSALALAQANMLLAACRRAFPDAAFEIKIIKTTGDKLQTASLSSATLPKGLFTKELEVALLNGEADLAVHSLKDLPTELPDGLQLGAVLERADARDVLVYREEIAAPSSGLTVAALPQEAAIATSSTRRAAHLTALRPDLKIVPIRGNVGTRLKKLAEQKELTATILAAAGMHRLQFRMDENHRLSGQDVPEGLLASPVSLDEMLPCVGQAAIGIETRQNDDRIADLCRQLNHEATFQAVTAERAFLRAMGGGCQLAVGAFARLEGDQIQMRTISFLGTKPQRASGEAAVGEAEALGIRLAEELRQP